MVAELASDEWTVETQGIAKRVGRYETKAKWKQMYFSPEGKVEQRIDDRSDSGSEIPPSDKKGKQIVFDIHDKGSDSSEESSVLLNHASGTPIVYSISISRSKEP
jgi:hypothetical protein